MNKYYIEYFRRNGEWFKHSGHEPMCEEDAVDQARRVIGERGITEARLVSVTSGAVYVYIKLESDRRPFW